jgi:hypothetical protein
MEYGFLVVIAICMGGGVAGGMLVAWGCHRRVLALEQNLKVILDAYDDRLNQLSKIVIRQDKSEAAKIKWSKKSADEEALAAHLAKPASVNGPGLPWDPRTWGDSK